MDRVSIIPPSQRRVAHLAAQNDSEPVLILGEAGTGREGIARWIHAHSPRAGLAFVEAHSGEPLHFQAQKAQGGTLLIQEIGEFPLSEQKWIQNVIETRSYTLPDSPGVRRMLNVRIFATTSRPLETRTEAGFFNPDLLDRLNQSRIEMPPLRDRRDEFEDIVLTLLQELTHTLKKDHVRRFEPEAFAALKDHTWPGNLRELRNVLHAAIESTEGDRVQLKDLPNFAEERAEFLSTRAEFQKLFRTLGLVKSDDNSTDPNEE